MKFRTLVLSTAGAMAMVGGAQAADLAVAAPGGVCPDGYISVGVWCFQPALRVRVYATYTDTGASTVNTDLKVVLRGLVETEIGTIKVNVPFAWNHAAPGLVGTDGAWIDIADMLRLGWFNPDGSGGQLGLDNDLSHSDFGNPDGVRAKWAMGGGSVAIGAWDAGDTIVDGNVLIAAHFAASMGGLGITISPSYLMRGVGPNGWGINGSIAGDVGSVKWKFIAGYETDNVGAIANHNISDLGTGWNVGGSFTLPVGFLGTLGVGAVHEVLAGAATDTVGVALAQTPATGLEIREEGTVNVTTSTWKILFRVQENLGGV